MQGRGLVRKEWDLSLDFRIDYFITHPRRSALSISFNRRMRFTSGFSPDSVFWQADGKTIKAGMRRLIADWSTNRLPFEKNLDPARELPFGVIAMLSQGSLLHVG